MKSTADRAIAIVGVGAILPDAPSAPAFWQNIVNKRYSISDVPSERWSVDDYYDPDPAAPDKTYSRIGGWVRGFEFDWKRYRIPPKVAEAMDESQQWAVAMADEALADYGYPDRPLNTDRTGVILGTAMGGEMHYHTNLRISFPEYANLLAEAQSFQQLPEEVQQAIVAQWHDRVDANFLPITEDSMPGELPNIIAGRVANVFNLRGPGYITDAACASSFAAINAASELLIEGHCDAVLTGGVDRNMGAVVFVKFCKIGALSATGSRPFGAGADGFVMGEGSGSFLLKRLSDAERDGDNIYAVIRGIGGSSDGKGKGITAPNPIGQVLATTRAWENAGLDPASATLVEAHGTSTRVGDVVELESLTRVFGGASRQSIGLGSAKGNVGHLKAGAGAAGLLKTVMALHHKTLPPTLNAERPNPNADFANSPFHLIHEARPWTSPNGNPRRAGVSAYGFGGTNFHLVLEEYVPGMLQKESQLYKGADLDISVASATLPAKTPLRGMLALGASDPVGLAEELDRTLQRVQAGWTPSPATPEPEVLRSQERLIIDFGDREELLDRMQKARKVMGIDNAAAWKALMATGIFRGSGPARGKVAFLFPGQGSQYLNMGRELAELEPVVAETFARANNVMDSVLDKPLTDYIFVDTTDPAAEFAANIELTQTAICQPAVLTMDTAMYKLLGEYGFRPDMAMGHSLGEYAALIAAGIMPFEQAVEASAARGREMTAVNNLEDKGWMAAVAGPYELILETLEKLDGYVIPANINSRRQVVIGGASEAVENAIQVFTEMGLQAMRIPVSHAFHTAIVAPASKPLRKVLDRLDIATPSLPLVANVTGDMYPITVEEIKDVLEKQVAAPVQWVKGLETLYAEGCRTFVEVGPKRALSSFANDVLGDDPDVVSLFCNHPKWGELPTFNWALCGLYAAGHGVDIEGGGVKIESSAEIAIERDIDRNFKRSGSADDTTSQPASPPSAVPSAIPSQELVQSVAEAITNLQSSILNHQQPNDRNTPPLGSVVISGTGLGLPGSDKALMDADNALRILRGEQFIDLIPERYRQSMVDKRITRLVKDADGNGTFKTITDPDEVIKLAGRAGSFDLEAEYGVPAKLIEALDSTTQMAMAAGLDALREAGIPLVQTYRRTRKGTYLPEKWMLPESLRDETGVIFASAFPGYDRLADEFTRYHTWQNHLSQVEMLEDLRKYTSDAATLAEINRRLADLRETIAREPYTFDRRFLFKILAMGHSQFAEYIGARGPNTHVNAACASTAQAVALAEDWIRSGRCRRVIVIGGDNVTSEHLMEWIGSGFLAVGAAATEDRVSEAALPFDRRRHGTILGMGACGLVIESEDAVRERGMRGIVELLSSETRSSAFHGTRLDVEHISLVMNSLVTTAERRFGLNRTIMAQEMVFMSHETFTPARGGSAAAEVIALRQAFGDAANDIVIANTKGLTGHPMGVGVEDVIAVKILEHGIVPPVPNFKEVDPDLGILNLSRGGRYPLRYAMHLAAGFGSQISLTLIRRIPGSLQRIDSQLQYERWLADVSGLDRAETEVVQRVLRVVDQGQSPRTPTPSPWRYGSGPILRADTPGDSGGTVSRPAPMTAVANLLQPAPQPVIPPTLSPEAREQRSEARSQKSEVREQRSEISPTPDLRPLTSDPRPPISETDLVEQQVLALVAEKTGYPVDMLDLDLDLEADLGIDTVKQAETFASVRTEFDIPLQENLNLRDYPTLGRVIDFVHEMRPDLGVSSEQKSVISADPPTSDFQPPISEIDPVEQQVLELVAEKTGYPVDMLDLDLDLEADLGIDTVKQAETFASVRTEFDIPLQENLNLRDYPTLGRVIDFVHEMRPDLAEVEEQRSEISPTSDFGPPTSDPVEERVLALVAEKTGYPVDMLDLDLDLEADLGIDTVKQAETFASVREEFDIPLQENLNLRDYPTLGSVIDFVHEMKPDLAEGREPESVSGDQKAVVSAAPPSADPRPSQPAPSPYNLEDADRFPRRVPKPVLRPGLDLCKATGVTLDGNSRVVVVRDQGGVGKALIHRLQKLGVTVLDAPADIATSQWGEQLQTWLAEGPIHGIYWLPALDVEPDLESLDLPSWRELNRVRTKNLYAAMRALYDVVSTPATFLLAGTRMGGLHGYGDVAATAPLGGAVSGFCKAYTVEQRLRSGAGPLVKVVDFEVSRRSAEPADQLIAETLFDPGVVEVGSFDGLRYGIGLVGQPADDGKQGLILGPGTVFVVTGAAGGITSAIIGDLATASGGVFYLLDLVVEPAADDPDIALFRSDLEALKQKFIAEAKAAGERPTPVMIDKRIMVVERNEAALRAIERVEAAGGRAFYRNLNLLDGEAVATVVEEIRQTYGRIDVLIHAGGLLIDRTLPDKEPEQFDLVFDVKADGFFNLLRAATGMPIAATIAFSSVAGRFGNNGQSDYSAANDLLCKLSSNMKRWRPDTRGIAIDWTAWGEIGMAARGSVPTVMEALGVDMLPPEVGVPTVRRELTLGATRDEVLVADRLGAWLDEPDPTGGLDPDAIADRLAGHEPPLLMVGEVKAARLYGGIEVETQLDPRCQPFLYDHAPDADTPWLPGVMATEALAEVASLFAPGWVVTAVENEQMLGAFKYFRMEPRTLYLNATLSPDGDDLLAHVVLRSHIVPRKEGLSTQIKEHFSADVRLSPGVGEAPVIDFTPPAPEDLAIGPDSVYDRFFHGPAYQVIARADVTENTAIALFANELPVNANPADSASLMAPRLVELCFQTVALWSLETRHAMAFPLGFDAVRVYGQELDAAGLLYAQVVADAGGETFDAFVVDESGRIYVELQGYRTISRPE